MFCVGGVSRENISLISRNQVQITLWSYSINQFYPYFLANQEPSTYGVLSLFSANQGIINLAGSNSILVVAVNHYLQYFIKYVGIQIYPYVTKCQFPHNQLLRGAWSYLTKFNIVQLFRAYLLNRIICKFIFLNLRELIGSIQDYW